MNSFRIGRKIVNVKKSIIINPTINSTIGKRFLAANNNNNILPCQRNLFDIPNDIHWFNCGYLGPGLKSQYEGTMNGLDRKLHPWKVSADDFFTDVEEFRTLISKLLHSDCRPQDIAVTASVSYACSTIAKNLKPKIEYYFNKKKKPLNIIVLKDQFPSNYYCWLDLCKEFGNDKLQIKIIERDMKNANENNCDPWTDNIINAIDEQTILVSVPNVFWSDGSLIDIERISGYINANNLRPQCHFALDLTQSLGARPFPMNIDIDYICCALYKWLLGPYGMGFLYVHPRHQMNENEKPLEFGWLERKNSRNFAEVNNYTNEFEEGAKRFDVGQRGHLQLMPMVLPALRQIIHEWTPIKIHNTLMHHNNVLSEKMTSIGLKVLNSPQQRSGHMLGIQFDPNKISGQEILDNMRKENIYVSIRAGSIRISPHLHCKEEEYDRLVDVISNVVLHKIK
eukprot:107130_1